MFVYKIVYVLLFDILFSIHVPSELLDIALTERIINMFFYLFKQYFIIYYYYLYNPYLCNPYHYIYQLLNMYVFPTPLRKL